MSIIQQNPYGTLTSAIDGLRERGYTYDFKQCEHHLTCEKLEKDFKPTNFTIKHVYRFEGMTNPSDNSVVYGIEADDGTKGILVDAYGVYADAISPEMIDKFRVAY